MKNLTLQSAVYHDLDLGPTNAGEDPIEHFCLDSTEGWLYAVTRNGIVLCHQGRKLVWATPLFEQPSKQITINGSTTLSVAAVTFLLELDALFVACSSGALLLLHPASQEVEEVGIVTGGVAAAAWSPDGELLALLGYNQLLLLMNKALDVLAEVPLPMPQPQGAPVAADTPTPPQLLSATITWRGDSKYFATNTCWSATSSSSSSSGADSAVAGSTHASITSRLLHIWDREDCQLHATGQPAAGMSAATAWQPNSRHLYVAATAPPEPVAAAPGSAGVNSRGQPLKAAPHHQLQQGTAADKQTAAVSGGSSANGTLQSGGRSSKQHVILYERNGLQHGGFDVPIYSSSKTCDSGMYIHALHWSSDSELLAVVLAPAAVKQQQQHAMQAWRVQLWHRSNWHWYLKHEQLRSIPAAAGPLLVTWDEALPGRLHILTGTGAYSVMEYIWGTSVSGRGTVVVVDGHQLLITPLRHGLVPPPMCCVRALLPCPVNAVAWLDGNIRADLCSDGDISTQQPTAAMQSLPLQDGNAPSVAAGSQQDCVLLNGNTSDDIVLQQGLCEVLAVLLSCGDIVFLRAVESDLWEETLEDQAAMGGPHKYLVPLGYTSPFFAAATAGVTPIGSSSAAEVGTANDSPRVQQQQYWSMPSEPWSAMGSTGCTAVSWQWQQQLLLPTELVAADDGPAIPLAEGRQVWGLVWLNSSRLLLLAAPDSMEDNLQDNAVAGTVLVEVSVQLPPFTAQTQCFAASRTEAANQVSSQICKPKLAAVATVHGKFRVQCAAPHPAGGALLQPQSGGLYYYDSGRHQLQELPEAAALPAPCRNIAVLPQSTAPAHPGTAITAMANGAAAISTSSCWQRAACVAAAAPAIGLSTAGVLYWGSREVAKDVVSFGIRGGGPGGPALLYVTRQALLYVVMVSQLLGYKHKLPDEASGAITWKRSEYPGDLRAAMSIAMRPGAAAAAAKDPHMRPVEPGAMVVASPWGSVAVVLQMQRGNLEGISPRLLVLAAICHNLQHEQYAQAWGLAITHRVDLNLLVDYAWPRFLQHADQVVQAVTDPADLCDLMAALKQDSVLQLGGLYCTLADRLGWQQQDQAGTGGRTVVAAAGVAGSSSDTDGSNKVSAVCAAIRHAVLQLSGRFLKGHLKTVVMSYARSDPQSLEGALCAIRDVKEAAVKRSSSSNSSNTIAAAGAAASCSSSGAVAVTAAVTVTAEEAASPAELSAAADAALKYLLLYVDVDQLYKVALGLYDLSLAFMVISHSQKDPGEYLAELTSLGSQPNEQLRRHAIDMSLGRYDKALDNLMAAGPSHFDAALELAKDKGLLRSLVALTQQQHRQQQQQLANNKDAANISRTGYAWQQQGPDVQQRLAAALAAYGEQLLATRKPEDAAVAFSAAGLTEDALQAYRTAGQWRMCMVLSARLGHSQRQQQELAQDLAEQLQSSGTAAEAATLLVEYLGDVDGGVSALVTAHAWREALRVAYAAGRSDLVDTIVVPAIARAASSMLSDASESIERLNKYSARLIEVGQRRAAMAAALATAEAEAATGAAAGLPDDDLVSEAPSIISGFSVYTDHTATGAGIGGSSIAGSSAFSRPPSTVGGRKPLRHERKVSKKGNTSKIRAGSPGEEAALAAHLASLGPAQHVLEEAGQLAELLVMLQHVDDAAKLQQRVGQWQAVAAAAMEEVAKGQQQQEQGAVAGIPGLQHRQQQEHQAGGGPSKAAKQQQQHKGGTASKPPTEEVRWKWDVLRG